jgi:chromosome segregation ATPase
MRVQVLVVLFTCISSGVVRAQDLPQTPPPTAPAAGQAAPQPDTETDRFPLLREAADTLRSEYEQLDAKNMEEIDKLTRTKRCQINRIGPLLDRTIDAMQQWLAAEKKYWEVWGEAEQKRVDSQMKTLAGMEADQKRVADLVETEKEDQQELQRRKAGLEQTRRTEEIAAQIDALIKDIQDSEARLADAQQQFESLTAQITNMKASISARLVGIRQNSARLDAYGLDMGAFYEKTRAAAHEVCNTKKPDERSTPLPKKGAAQ